MGALYRYQRQNNLPGLYAARNGVLSINGANRLVPLPDRAAGFRDSGSRAAAAHATNVAAPASAAIGRTGCRQQRRLDRQFFRKDGGKEESQPIRQEMPENDGEGAESIVTSQRWRRLADAETLRERFRTSSLRIQAAPSIRKS